MKKLVPTNFNLTHFSILDSRKNNIHFMETKVAPPTPHTTLFTHSNQIFVTLATQILI